jgi:hypothetical protein
MAKGRDSGAPGFYIQARGERLTAVETGVQMHRSPIHPVAAAVATSILILAPLSARAQSPAAAPASASPLTLALAAKMQALITYSGHDASMAAPYDSALDVTAAGQPWANRQVRAADNGATHYAGIGRGTDQDIVQSVTTPSSTEAFWAHPDGTLVNALSFDATTHATTMHSPAEAQADFAAECGFWTQNIDGFLARK